MKTIKNQLLLLGILTILLGQSITAQTDTVLTTYVVARVQTLDVRSAKNKVSAFIDESKVIVLKAEDNTDHNYQLTFVLDKDQFAVFQNRLASFGVVESNILTTINYIERIEKANEAIRHLQSKKENFEKILNEMDSKSDRYYEYFEKKMRVEEEIHEKEVLLHDHRASHGRYVVELIIHQESGPGTQSNFDLVNMPGVEYSYLRVENPLSGLSAAEYHGVFLKYMFTRGKTYALMGAFKDMSPQATSDTLAYDEMFMFAIGQDFYSRYFGRGKRKTMNLYSSFNLGFGLATNETKIKGIWHLSPYVGVELLKTKHVLIDTKVGYFIPFNHNRNLRGLNANLSFNFVF